MVKNAVKSERDYALNLRGKGYTVVRLDHSAVLSVFLRKNKRALCIEPTVWRRGHCLNAAAAAFRRLTVHYFSFL
jgi:hypothetical protein